MRFVQVMIPAGKRDAVMDALDRKDVDYVLTDETSSREFVAVVYVPLPTNAVEPVLAELRDAGLDEDAYTVVLDAETVISRRFDALREKYDEETENDDRIAREELKTKATELAPAMPTFVIMTIVSAVIATAGLLLDSPAVVVGSMVIAPLIGPAMAASVGTVVDDHALFVRGVKLQAIGLVLAVTSAAVFAWFAKTANVVPPGIEITSIPEIRERLAPGFLSLIVALGAGVAGVVSLSTGVSSALVGVMISVALLPPAAVVGIGLAWGLPMVSLGSGVLTLVNGVSVNFAALATLRYEGYRPENWFQASEARSATTKRIVALAVVILVLSAFLGGVTLSSVQSATFEQQANQEVSDALSAPPYANLTLLEFSVQHGDGIVFKSPRKVVVTVGRPAGENYPGLASALDRRIHEATGENVVVEVRFVEVSATGE